MIRVEKRTVGPATYYFIRRWNISLEDLRRVNNKTIRDAANTLGMDVMSFLICLGHLKAVGLIKEVRIV